MVKILNCYLYAKKVMALCLRVQFFWPTLCVQYFFFNLDHLNISKPTRYNFARGWLTNLYTDFTNLASGANGAKLHSFFNLTLQLNG